MQRCVFVADACGHLKGYKIKSHLVQQLWGMVGSVVDVLVNYVPSEQQAATRKEKKTFQKFPIVAVAVVVVASNPYCIVLTTSI